MVASAKRAVRGVLVTVESPDGERGLAVVVAVEIVTDGGFFSLYEGISSLMREVGGALQMRIDGVLGERKTRPSQALATDG